MRETCDVATVVLIFLLPFPTFVCKYYCDNVSVRMHTEIQQLFYIISFLLQNFISLVFFGCQKFCRIVHVGLCYTCSLSGVCQIIASVLYSPCFCHVESIIFQSIY